MAKKVPATKKQAKPASSSSSSDSSSEDEAPAKKVAAKKVVAKKAASSDSSSDDSSSEDEAPAKKVVAKKAAAPVKKAESSSSDDSSSEDEAPAKKAAAPAAKKVVKKESSSSSSDDSSDEEEAAPAKKAASPAKKVVKKESSDSSDDSSSSSSEDEAPVMSKKRKNSDAEKPAAKLQKQADGNAAPVAAATTTEVFIAGLPWAATEEEVREKFAECGEISKINLPQANGRPSGNAFITFATSEGSDAALALDGQDFGGRWMKIRSAEKKANFEEKPEGCTSVFIGNLSWDCNEDLIREAFGGCGEILSCRLATDRETGEFRGFGHLDFETTEAVDEAMKLAGEYVGGRAIRVSYAKSRENFSGGGDRNGGGRGGFGGRGGGRGGRGGFDGGRGGRGGFGGRGGGRGGFDGGRGGRGGGRGGFGGRGGGRGGRGDGPPKRQATTIQNFQGKKIAFD